MSRDLVELVAAGGQEEEEEPENSGFADGDGNEVGAPSDEDAGLTAAPVDDVELTAKKPGERTVVATGVVRRRPKAYASHQPPRYQPSALHHVRVAPPRFTSRRFFIFFIIYQLPPTS